jgi:hypothetical protein
MKKLKIIIQTHFNIMKKISSFLIFAFLFPMTAFAAPSDFTGLMQIFLNLLGIFMSVLYAVAFVTFFWGLVKYIWNTDDPKGREEGTKWMAWSVLALFVMVTLWGIVGILVRTFNLTPLVIPQLGK